MTYNDIITALSGAGIAVYHPGMKEGVCTAPYVVVQNTGTYQYAQSQRLGYTLMSVICYAPIGRYGELDALIARVKAALASLAPDLRPTGNEGIHTVNDRFRAYESYVEYMLQKRLF